jgi:hypothetical protein
MTEMSPQEKFLQFKDFLGIWGADALKSSGCEQGMMAGSAVHPLRCSFTILVAAFTGIRARRSAISAVLAAVIFLSLGNGFLRFDFAVALGMSAVLLSHSDSPPCARDSEQRGSYRASAKSHPERSFVPPLGTSAALSRSVSSFQDRDNGGKRGSGLPLPAQLFLLLTEASQHWRHWRAPNILRPPHLGHR